MHVPNQLRALDERKLGLWSARTLALVACSALFGAGRVAASANQDPQADVAREGAAERKEAARLRRRGEAPKAVHALVLVG